ncbi:RICIN domain-containing protein [Micromonospora sp. NPDC050695]|uniref:RICIN domain-containing protein n=1 Tax=Micromonospora sp. NPDC050695 TaxID=3154938 RepID=UPI0033DA6325
MDAHHFGPLARLRGNTLAFSLPGRLVDRGIAAGLGLAVAVAIGIAVHPTADAAPANFRVLAFYNAQSGDAAHDDFVKDAKTGFPRLGEENGFTWESTTDWGRLSGDLSNYKVVMFLNDAPHDRGQQAGFKRYMDNGGAWMGFHVSAFTQHADSWDWYYNTFLGSGNFRNNSWDPTTAVLRINDRNHPSTAGLPATIKSSVSEWYTWSNNLGQNPDIDVIASIDESGPPVGTRQKLTGSIPVMWTNKNYKMLYANFGHNARPYNKNIQKSSTFDSDEQNQWMINGLRWLGGRPGSESPPTGNRIDPETWYSLVNKNSGKCVEARGAGTSSGTAIQQSDCTDSMAQQFKFLGVDDGYVRILRRDTKKQVLDVTDRSTKDNAKIQTWSYVGGTNQEWRPVEEGGGYYHFISRNSRKCLSVPDSALGNGIRLVVLSCKQTNAQSFSLKSNNSDPGDADPNPGDPDPNPGDADPNPGDADPNPGDADPNPGDAGPCGEGELCLYEEANFRGGVHPVALNPNKNVKLPCDVDLAAFDGFGKRDEFDNGHTLDNQTSSVINNTDHTAHLHLDALEKGGERQVLAHSKLAEIPDGDDGISSACVYD